MDPTMEQHKICANFGKNVMETLAMIRQASREERMG
jgi:hypothetical protein